MTRLERLEAIADADGGLAGWALAVYEVRPGFDVVVSVEAAKLERTTVADRLRRIGRHDGGLYEEGGAR